MQAPSIASVYAVLMLMLVLSGLDQTVLSTALPSIVESLQGQHLAPWVFSAYLMASTATIPLYGKLADRWGVRPLLLFATGIFTLGSLACAQATSMPLLVAARALQGLGGGGLMTLTMLAVAALYPPAERGARMGMLGAAYGISTLVGPLAGGLLLQVASWRWAFWLNVPCAAVAWAVLKRSAFGAPQPVRHRLDVAGAVLLAGGLVAVLLATRRDLGVDSQRWAAGAGVVMLLAWGGVAWRAVDPVVPLGLFRRAPFAATAVISAVSGVALFGAVVFLPLYLQRGLGYSPLASALHTFPLMLGVTIGAQASGRALRAGRSPRVMAASGALSMLLGFLAVAAVLRYRHDSAWVGVGVGLALTPIGGGLGFLFPLVTAVAQRSAPPTRIGVATAVPVMLRSLGGALGVALMADGLTRHMARAMAAGIHSQDETAQAFATGVVAICVWSAAASALALLASRALPVSLGAGPAAPDIDANRSRPPA